MLTFLTFLIFTPLTFLAIVMTALSLSRHFFFPKLNRNWILLQSKTPNASIEGDKVKVVNLRSATYTHDGFYKSPNYTNSIYNLKDLKSAWIYCNTFSPFMTHPILSFQFGDRFLAVSVEVRKTVDEPTNIFKTFFFNYEIYYILATEEDLYTYRKFFPGSSNAAYLYKLNLSENEVKELFHRIVNKVQLYSRKAFFYRITYRNSLIETIHNLNLKKGDYSKSLLSYYNFPKYLFDHKKTTDQSKTFKEFIRNGSIAEIVEKLEQNENFSHELRKQYYEIV